jgi:hypothetical protein
MNLRKAELPEDWRETPAVNKNANRETVETGFLDRIVQERTAFRSGDSTLPDLDNSIQAEEEDNSMIATMKNAVVCIVLVAVTSLIVVHAPAFAHHGGEINWQQDNLVGPVTMTATKFAFSFPHPQFYAEMKDRNGRIESWSIVLRPTPTGLRERGWTRNSIKPGDVLTVSYNPHKTAPRVAIARRVLINGKFLPIEAGEE